MSRVEWNKAGERLFEAGADRGVLYPRLGQGVAWNGLISITESTQGGEMESLYFDGVKYLDMASSEDFGATLEAYSAPHEFAASDGQKYISPGLSVTQQPRRPFGLCYRTLIGNDLDGLEHGYKLHVVYNCTASPSDRTNKTLGATVDPSIRSWRIDAVPPAANTYRPTAHVVIDSTMVSPLQMEQLELALYGRDETESLPAIEAYLPSVSEIVLMLTNPLTEFLEATV